ncbi:MAG: CDP-diacylglycerol--glycerol-3-phosphate 3-phosphatidyltransferase, partial [Planctomycetaceae bacterium]|nr:CDP-diacylglycerol--glycerol-3-phosphate 3-phosphatidyltransferase [Planctomycetaceae bacterium]
MSDSQSYDCGSVNAKNPGLIFFPKVVNMTGNVLVESFLARLSMNVPNSLTLLRVLFAIIVFVLIGLHHYDLALLFFLLASLTDALDGWWARHYQQITVFGRIMDPFADKFLICGAFICLVAIPDMISDKAGYPAWLMLQPWMVIIIIARELLVTTLRAFVESSGGDFSAKWLGKLKMVLQCAAVVLALLYLSGGAEWNLTTFNGKELLVQDFERVEVAAQKTTLLAQGLDYVLGTKGWRTTVFFTMLSSFWLTVGITLLSGLDYSIHATKMIR